MPESVPLNKVRSSRAGGVGRGLYGSYWYADVLLQIAAGECVRLLCVRLSMLVLKTGTFGECCRRS